MPFVFELDPLYLPGSHRQIGVFALQGLHPRHFIHTFHTLSLFGQFRGLLIELVNIGHFFIKTGFISRCQPVATQVGLYISVFLKAWPHGVAKFP